MMTLSYLSVFATIVVSASAASSSSSSFASSVGASTVLDIVGNVEKSLLDSLASSSVNQQCFAVIEAAKKVLGEGDAPEETKCKGLKHVCGECNQCSSFTSSVTGNGRQCICVSADSAATFNLLTGNDCLIVEAGVTFTGTVNGGAGHDCFVDAGDSSAATFNGDGNSLTFVEVQNVGKDGPVVNGGNAADCFVIARDGGEFFGYGGNDVFFVPTFVEPSGYYANFDGDGGNDLFIVHGIVGDRVDPSQIIYGDDGNDIVLVEGQILGYVDLGAGADYVHVFPNARIAVDQAYTALSLGEGANKAIVEGTIGGRGSTGIEYAIRAGDGNDHIEIRSGGYALGQVAVGDGNNFVHLASSAKIFVSEEYSGIVAGEGKDTVIVSGSIFIGAGSTEVYQYAVSVGAGDDHVFIKDHAILDAGIDLGDGSDYVIVESEAVVKFVSDYYAIEAGGGDDKIVIAGNLQFVDGSSEGYYAIDAGTGNDDILIQSGAQLANGIEGGDGDDKIKVEYGAVVRANDDYYGVDGGDGDDIIEIDGFVVSHAAETVDAYFVYGGAGDDVIQIGSKAQVYNVDGGPGEDRILVAPRASGHVQNVQYVYGGADNDVCFFRNLERQVCDQEHIVDSSDSFSSLLTKGIFDTSSSS